MREPPAGRLGNLEAFILVSCLETVQTLDGVFKEGLEPMSAYLLSIMSKGTLLLPCARFLYDIPGSFNKLGNSRSIYY